jgi:hypothetical protein
MPASSRLRFIILPGTRNWPSFTGHFFLALVRRKSLRHARARKVDLDRESIWISYCPMSLESREQNRLGKFSSHHRLAAPVSPWERLKIGGGTPPVLTRYGWLIIYHGVKEMEQPRKNEHQLCYSAGVMILSKEHPQVIHYRSVEPVLTPDAAAGMQRRPSPTSCSRPASTGATISAYPIASTSITGWPTGGLVLHVLTCRISYRRKESQTPRKQRCSADGFVHSRCLQR